MNASLHSPTGPRDHIPEDTTNLITEKTEITRVTRRPVRAEGFGNRFPILFDHRDDMPARELAHWGPASRVLLESFLIPALIIIIAALIAIAWYVM